MSVFKVGVGGPVGSGKTALVERLVPLMMERGLRPAVIANDVITQEDALILRRALDGIIEAERVIGVETGTCPHTAVREDPSLNLAAVEEIERRFPDVDLVFIESGGDNLTLTFSPLLADRSIYVMDVAGGEKTPRKQGPGMIQSDLLVLNKADLAPYVGADLGVMERDARTYREGPLCFTDCRHSEGVEPVADWLLAQVEAARAVGVAHDA